MNQADYLNAELIERIAFSSNHFMLRFRLDGPFSFRAGQYATVALADGDRLIPRAYSIVSSPHDPLLEFYIELVKPGALTPRLWQLRPGDRAYIRNRAAGRMGLVKREGVKNHLIIATVAGVAPFISMTRTYAAEKETRGAVAHRFAIIHGASHRPTSAFTKTSLRPCREKVGCNTSRP